MFLNILTVKNLIRINIVKNNKNFFKSKVYII